MLRKFFNTEIKSIDEKARTVEVVFSTEDEDRDGEIVVQAGWDFEDYSKNPVVLWGHNPSEPPVGKTLDVRTEGMQSIAKIQMADDTIGDRLWRLIKQGILRTVSAGFINTERDGERLLENKLLEISWVSIPANQNAITLAYESDMITQKDCQWLEKSMVKQLDMLRDIIKEDEQSKTKKEGEQMNEAKLQELLTNTVSEAVKPLQEKLEALESSIAEQQAAKPETPKAEEEQAPEGETKPAPTGGNESEEGQGELSSEEIMAAIAEGIAEAETAESA